MNNMNPSGGLPDLIEMKRAGRTNVELAKDSGGNINAPAISNLLAKGLREFPSVASLRGYALALKVSTGEVIEAAAISLGLNPGGAAGVSNDLVISGAGVLPDKSRAFLRDTAAHLLWWQEQAEAPAAEEPAQDWHALAASIQHEPTESERHDAYFDQLGEESQ